MPSVMGLLEERERAALQAELREAEAAWERLVITRETVGRVLAETRGREDAPVSAAKGRSGPVVGAVPGSVVPVWRV